MTSGIYQILNLLTGDKYIGSTTNIVRRWQEHHKALRNGSHHCKHLLAAWEKYGEDAFEFAILEYCEPSDLLDREQTYLPTEQTVDALKEKGFYNQTPIAGRPQPLGSSPTEEVRRKLSAENVRRWQNEEYRKRMTEKARLQWQNPEYREKMSRLARESSAESVIKMSLGASLSKQRRIRESGQLSLLLDESIK